MHTRSFQPRGEMVIKKQARIPKSPCLFCLLSYLKLSLTLGSEVLEIGCLCLCSLQLFAKFLQVILQSEQEALSVVRRQNDTALNFCLRSTRNYTDKI